MAAILILVAVAVAALASAVSTALTSSIRSPGVRLAVGIGAAVFVGILVLAMLWLLVRPDQ